MLAAAIPEIWFEKLMMPPTFPTSFLLAIRDGIDHPTGAAGGRPPIRSPIQITKRRALCGFSLPRRARGGKAANRQADPNQRVLCAVGIRCAEDAKATSRTAHKHGFTHAACVPPSPDQPVHKPAANQEIGEGCKQPWHAGVEKRMQHVDVQRK